MEEENIQAKDNGVDSHSKPPEFYIISVSKFWILNILTMGAFSTVWLYLQWHRQNLAGRERVEPFWRTVFAIFFYHSLTDRIKAQTEIVEVSEKWKGGLVATSMVLLIILDTIINQIEKHLIRVGDEDSLTSILGWAIFIATMCLDWNIQSKINIGYGDPKGTSNFKITKMNIVWVITFWIIMVSISTIWYYFKGN